MFDTYSGATRVYFVAGDPIAQVKSPAMVTAALRARGIDAIVVPAHVAPDDFAAWLRAVTPMRNLDGILVTVPHKFAAAPLCASLSRRGAAIGAVNALRRDPAGGWHGDMCDGEGHVDGLRKAGCRLEGRRALLAGAGGAGSAIAHALVDAGMAEIAIHDPDRARAEALLAKLRAYGAARVAAGSDDPHGYDLAVNATPLGMYADDPLPFRIERLAASTFVSDVITVPAVPPLIAAARERGCGTMTGIGMFEAVRDCLVRYFTEGSSA